MSTKENKAMDRGFPGGRLDPGNTTVLDTSYLPPTTSLARSNQGRDESRGDQTILRYLSHRLP